MYKFIVLFSFFIFQAFGDTNLILNDKQNIYDDFQFSYSKDPNSSLTLQTLPMQKFSLSNNKFALGYTKGSVWIKFDVLNRSDTNNFVLSLGESFYEKANLYYFQKDINTTLKRNGLFIPIQERELYTNKLAFKVPLPKNEKTTIVIELEGKYAYFGEVTLAKENSFYPYALLDFNTFYLLLFGICAIIMFFNLFLYSKLKEKVYGYYAMYSFFNLLYLINISGLLVYLDLQQYIYKLQFSASFMMGFLILFSIEMLDIKKYLPRIGKYFVYLCLPSFFFGVMILFSYQPWNKFINNYSGLISLFLIVVSIMVYFKGNTKSKYYILALVLYFLFAIFFTSMIMGLVEYSFTTRYGFVIASTIEVMIFSLMLANRYFDIQKDFIESQKKLIEVKTKNEIFLENEVKQRTSQLENLLDEREMLIKEVHHRVKNNFHTLIGLLWLEEQNDIQDKEKFQNIRNRIKSMSMIHEKLYNSKDIKNISIKEYLEQIIHNLTSSKKTLFIELHQELEDIILKFDAAVSIGIICNEVISNSIKHNKERTHLSLSIKLFTQDDTIVFSIEDDGIGFDLDKTYQGLGMDIINSFSKKLLSSSYKFTIENGTTFVLKFLKEPDGL